MVPNRKTSASKWAPAEVEFQKLDDLPKGRPHTPDAVLRAMKVLHDMVYAQAKAYGGKDSKLLPVGITEAPTFKTYLNLLELEDLAASHPPDELNIEN